MLLSLILILSCMLVKKCDGQIAGEKVDKDQMSFATAALVQPRDQNVLQITENERNILI